MAQKEREPAVLRYRLDEVEEGWEASCEQLPHVRVTEESPAEALDAVQDAAELEQQRDQGMHDDSE